MAEHLRLINTEAPPNTGPFAMTETARDMLRSLNYVRSLNGGGMTMIAGAPGTGKTETVLQYMRGNRLTYVFKAVSGEGGIWSAAHGIFGSLNIEGEPNGRNLAGARKTIADAIGLDGMLIIDEAQYLVQKNPRGKDTIDALEWLRSISEDGCCCIVFVGDLALLDAVEKLPQLKSRLDTGRTVIVRRVSKADVQAVAAKLGHYDHAVIDMLFAVSRRAGGLRNVTNVLALAAMFAAGGKIELLHIAGAIEDLKLQSLGGK